MTIVVTGGGSGGHITPILAVAYELKKLQPGVRIVYIGQTGDPFAEVPKRDVNIDAVYTVSAGKFRRYYGEGIKQLFDVKTVWLNTRDLFRIARGFMQSRRLMRKLRPSVVFSRGGYVSVPVALAGKTRGIPYITHDSDSIPSLANRIIAPWAAKNAVALPTDIYPYNQAKAVTVGVPVMAEFNYVSPDTKRKFRQELGLHTSAPTLFIIGGGQGAQRINSAIMACMEQLFKEVPNLQILHVAGEANQQAIIIEYQQTVTAEQMKRVKVFGYIDGVHRYSAASDVILTRAGASSIAEFAVQGKACVIVPSPFLVAGHQLKNAQYLEEQQAAVVVDEGAMQKDPRTLGVPLIALLNDPKKQIDLGDKFATFGHRDSARLLAELVLAEARQ